MQPLQTSAFNVNVPGQTNFNWRYISTTANLGIALGATSAVINITNNYGGSIIAVDNQNGATINLPQARTLPNGWQIWILNQTGTALPGSVTIAQASGDSLETRSGNYALKAGEGLWLMQARGAWYWLSPSKYYGYDENSTRAGGPPSATGTNSVAIGIQVTSSASYSVAIGAPSSSASGSYSVALQGVAGPSNSTAIGYNSGNTQATTATGGGAMALGGSYASGTDSFAAAMANNTSSYGARGANTIAIGKQAQAIVSSAIAIGDNAQSTGSGGFCIAMGYTSIASGPGAVAIGNQYALASTIASGQSSTSIGDGCNATQAYATSLGAGANSVIIGKYAYSSAGYFAASGDAQTGTFVLRRATTDATATILTTNGNAAAATNQIILPASSAYSFTGTVVARQQAAGGTASAAWKVEGLIRREANAGTTTLVASTVTAISNVPAWTLALSADTTNGGLAVTATGAAATNIQWVATIQTSECTYA
jgi:hypothetical protein